MSSSRGRWLPLSLSRRLAADWLRVSRGVPTATIDRCMPLASLVAARQLWQPRPHWTAILIKAYALVSAEQPALRRCYIRFPWPHLYEHPEPVGLVTMERTIAGENQVFLAQVRKPHIRPLVEIDAHLRRCKTAKVEDISSFRRAARWAGLPWFVRRPALWWAVHGSGRLRTRHFGTFGVTSVTALGAGVMHLPLALTACLHSGLFDASGSLEMRLTFDHRVLDGADAARALTALESVLLTQVLEELRHPVAMRVAA